jgi:hypothetical protein
MYQIPQKLCNLILSKYAYSQSKVLAVLGIICLPCSCKRIITND